LALAYNAEETFFIAKGSLNILCMDEKNIKAGKFFNVAQR
jgi:hypothetical protein